MKDVIEKYVGYRYGLEITGKEPKALKEDPKYAELRIDKWQIAIVTAPEQKIWQNKESRSKSLIFLLTRKYLSL